MNASEESDGDFAYLYVNEIYQTTDECQNLRDQIDDIYDIGIVPSTHLLRHMLSVGKTVKSLYIIGAGPIEDLLFRYGDAMREPYESLFKESVRFRFSITTIYEPTDPPLEWLTRLIEKAKQELPLMNGRYLGFENAEKGRARRQ